MRDGDNADVKAAAELCGVKGGLTIGSAIFAVKPGDGSAREQAASGIPAVRGGTGVGEHEVPFAGEDEILTLSHRARSQKVCAAGALRAAKFLKGRPAGRYDMNDVLAAL